MQTRRYPVPAFAVLPILPAGACLLAVAATALFVTGPEHWRAFARASGIKYVMLTDTDGRIHINPAVQQRIHLVNPETSPIVLSDPL